MPRDTQCNCQTGFIVDGLAALRRFALHWLAISRARANGAVKEPLRSKCCANTLLDALRDEVDVEKLRRHD